MTATLASANLASPLRPLAETAALFRQECSALDHLIEELYRDVEQLREELVKKSDDIEEGRRKLAERGRQLAEQRKESGRLVGLLEQQETRAAETLNEVKSLRDQLAREREESQQREAARTAFLEQKLRSIEGERDQLRHELNVLQATAAASNSSGGAPAESLAPLLSELGEMRRQLGETQAPLLSELGEMRRQLGQTQAPLLSELGEMRRQFGETQAPLLSELGEMRRQFGETQNQIGQQHAQFSETRSALDQTQAQLAEARTQLAAAIERSTAAVEAQVALVAAQPAAGQPADEQTVARFNGLERERLELESELELVRTRATELQELVNQQRRELVEQRADVTTELRLLRELVEQRGSTRAAVEYEPEEEPALVGASSRGGSDGPPADPVVSSVMAQFARLQKDVAQRRKKK